MWICPTFGRPQRLKELARSWERCQPATRLHVRLWRGDPCYLEYKTLKWPHTWRFYDSDMKGCGEALEEFFELHPEEPFYGFVADDIVLRTKGGMEHLQALAIPFFIAYPNDTIQRQHHCTHFCIGGDLVREVGFFAHTGFGHGFIDTVWMSVGLSTGLLRYAPHVIFQHKHFFTDPALHDETYRASYADASSKEPDTVMHLADYERYQKYLRDEHEAIVQRIQRELFVQCEDWDEWLSPEEKSRIGYLQSAAA